MRANKRVRSRPPRPRRVTRDRAAAPAARGVTKRDRARKRASRAGTHAKRNPTSPSLDAAMRAAGARLEAFSGHAPRVIGKVTFPDNPRAALAIGSVIGIAYETVRDGEKEKYFHRFKATARPLLVSSPDGRQLFIVGGRYNFTERGIVDDA